jgi:predicted transcriptional regulator of viral defense system
MAAKTSERDSGRLGRSEYGLLTELRRTGKTTLALPHDRQTVERYSTRPLRLLSQMAQKGLLRRVQRGHYVVLGPGGGSLREEVPTFSTLDAAFGDTRYAITFLSALAYYDLTDHTPYAVTLIADLPEGATPPRQIAGIPVRARAERRDDRWFGVRRQEDGFGSFCIADPERAILDSLASPAFAGGPEVAVRALARGLRDDTLRIARLVRYGSDHSIRLARTTGFLLELLGVADDERLAPLKTRAKQTRRYDKLFGLDDDEAELEVSAAWWLQSAIPASVIRAWAAYNE